MDWKLTDKDKSVLRDLAGQYMEIAIAEGYEQLRELWKDHNELKESRPLILVESAAPGVRDEILPDSTLQCEEPWAVAIEKDLRLRLYHFREIQDDNVPALAYCMNWLFWDTGFGVEVKRESNTEDSAIGFHWDPPLKDLEKDFGKLQEREFIVDKKETLARREFLESVFGDIMPVEIRGNLWWTNGMTWTAIDLIGLENLMLLMYDQPEHVHKLMQFLCEDHQRRIDFCEREGILTLNNAEDGIGSGSKGFSRELPGGECRKTGQITAKDLWGLLESQETVGVSPDMFAEFVLPYQKTLAERYGLVYYGCCEPLHKRWEHVKTVPNLRSVSISPWCDQEYMAEELGRNYVFSRKPNPAMLSTERLDEEAVRRDIRHTLDLTRGCNVELVMKDLHTTQGNPERMQRWVQICREEIEAG